VEAVLWLGAERPRVQRDLGYRGEKKGGLRLKCLIPSASFVDTIPDMRVGCLEWDPFSMCHLFHSMLKHCNTTESFFFNSAHLNHSVFLGP